MPDKKKEKMNILTAQIDQSQMVGWTEGWMD